jgi:hypothetical protein
LKNPACAVPEEFHLEDVPGVTWGMKKEATPGKEGGTQSECVEQSKTVEDLSSWSEGGSKRSSEIERGVS